MLDSSDKVAKTAKFVGMENNNCAKTQKILPEHQSQNSAVTLTSLPIGLSQFQKTFRLLKQLHFFTLELALITLSVANTKGSNWNTTEN